MWMTLLFKYWKYAALLLLIAGVYGYWHNLTSTIKDQQSQIVQNTMEIEKYKNDIELLKDGVLAQNEAIIALQNKKILIDKQLDNARLNSEIIAKKLSEEINRLVVPKGCEESIQFLRDNAK